MEKNFYTFLIAACATAMSAQLPASAQETRPSLIDEDKVWVYKSIQDWGARHLISYMRFDGVKEYGGREYHRFHTFKTQRGEQGVTYPEFDHNPSERDFYLREEDRRVWLLVEGNNGVGDGEILLYDFNLRDGDSITIHPVADSDCEETYTVRTSDPVDVGGHRCKVLWYEELEMQQALNIYMIEGIGPSVHGTLGYYSLLYTSGEGADGSSGGVMATRPDADLLMVCDAGGNVIFDNVNDGPNATYSTTDIRSRHRDATSWRYTDWTAWLCETLEITTQSLWTCQPVHRVYILLSRYPEMLLWHERRLS